ncbi:MAG: alpha/beta hydrolase family protein [Kiritimatiellia bacterium]|nr:alpha/beta hydrolase family protein [Kiritimatiellia bacterium]
MALLSVQFFSQSLCKYTAMNIILPPGKGPFPVLYLLHGLSDDYTSWQRRTSIERYVEGKRLIVVMPDGGRSFYCNDGRRGGPAYEDHIIKDVVGFVDETFRTVATRRARAIAGLSMGGYGALMLALKHAEIFSVVCAHSSATGFTHLSYPDSPLIGVIADALPKDGRYDLFLLAQKAVKSRNTMALRIDCGLNDSLLNENREFHAHLKKIGFKHEYREFPGVHSWAYWDIHIQQSIAFILSHLKDKK